MVNLQRCERHVGIGALKRTPVVLHIYDLSKGEAAQGVNAFLRRVGASAFHAGVEVFGVEWSYGSTPDDEDGSGIFDCEPTQCGGHYYRESLPMGMTTKTPDEVWVLLESMRSRWLAEEYDLLRQNCCHWSDVFCQELGVEGLPFWVSLNISGMGNSLRRMTRSVLTDWVAGSVGSSTSCRDRFRGKFELDECHRPAHKCVTMPCHQLSPRILRDDGSGEWLRRGDPVEVFSSTAQAWCLGSVEGVGRGRVLVAYHLPGGARGTKELFIGDPALRRPWAYDDATPSKGWRSSRFYPPHFAPPL